MEHQLKQQMQEQKKEGSWEPFLGKVVYLCSHPYQETLGLSKHYVAVVLDESCAQHLAICWGPTVQINRGPANKKQLYWWK